MPVLLKNHNVPELSEVNCHTRLSRPKQLLENIPRVIFRLVHWMGDRLRQINHRSISPSYPGQLSLLPSAGREMSTSQSVVMLCGWGVKASMVHSTCG